MLSIKTNLICPVQVGMYISSENIHWGVPNGGGGCGGGRCCPKTSNFKMDLKFQNFPGELCPRTPPPPQRTNHYKMKTGGFQGQIFPWATLFIVADQLKMHYGLLSPRTSHDILSAKRCLVPPE